MRLSGLAIYSTEYQFEVCGYRGGRGANSPEKQLVKVGHFGITNIKCYFINIERNVLI